MRDRLQGGGARFRGGDIERTCVSAGNGVELEALNRNICWKEQKAARCCGEREVAGKVEGG